MEGPGDTWRRRQSLELPTWAKNFNRSLSNRYLIVEITVKYGFITLWFEIISKITPSLYRKLHMMRFLPTFLVSHPIIDLSSTHNLCSNHTEMASYFSHILAFSQWCSFMEYSFLIPSFKTSIMLLESTVQWEIKGVTTNCLILFFKDNLP